MRFKSLLPQPSSFVLVLLLNRWKTQPYFAHAFSHERPPPFLTKNFSTSFADTLMKIAYTTETSQTGGRGGFDMVFSVESHVLSAPRVTVPRYTSEQKKALILSVPHTESRLSRIVGGVDGTRTRDPRRDRPVF